MTGEMSMGKSMTMGNAMTMGKTMSNWMGAESTLLPREGQHAGVQKEVSRRRTRERHKTVLEALDELTEDAFQSNVERPWYLETCLAAHPVCERICFPAERATRRKHDGGDNGKKTGSQDKSGHTGGDDDRWFGLPDFTASGFQLVPDEDLRLQDMSLHSNLGLTIASHCKTGFTRYCLRFQKMDLPVGVGGDQIVGLARQLLRCDHINVLSCKEAFEDADALYFMYEYLPCVTLQSAYLHFDWTQEQVVNLVREISSAFVFALTIGLNHLWLNPGNILLPACVKHHGHDTSVSKVFGFGLLGTLHSDCADHLCWSPESIERYTQNTKDSPPFVKRMDGAMRQASDAWSLGTIIYTIAAKSRPFTDEQKIVRRLWNFTMAFDIYDAQAKYLVETLLTTIEKRGKLEQILHHEWIRRRWAPPPGQEVAFTKLEEFVSSSLSKRLFGRFLVRFLDAEHVRTIAHSFNALDKQGCGMLRVPELGAVAKGMGKPHHVAQGIVHWLAVPGQNYISLSRFSEAFAEEVIDGKALRQAFESLDDDGSEEISATELFDVLRELDAHLTMNDVEEHIRTAEAAASAVKRATPKAAEAAAAASATMAAMQSEGAAGKAEGDEAIDYDEFVQLFPVTVRRARDLTERILTDRTTAEEMSGRFKAHSDRLKEWLDQVQATLKDLQEGTEAALQRTPKGQEAAKGLSKELSKLQNALQNPPGSYKESDYRGMLELCKKEWAKNTALLDALVKGKQAGKIAAEPSRKKAANVAIPKVFGVDSFLQDASLIECWSMLIYSELRTLKMVFSQANRLTGTIDQHKAYEVGKEVTEKVGAVVSRAHLQFEEYEAFADAMSHPEATMTSGRTVCLSGRGLRPRSDEAAKGGAEGDDDGASSAWSRFIADVKSRL